MTKPDFIRFDPDVPLEIWPDFPESEVASGSRGSSGHLFVDVPEHGLSAGIWTGEASLGRWVDWPAHELIVMIEGEVVIVEEDRETVVGPGDCVFIPKGRRCIWNQHGFVRKFMVVYDDKAAAAATASQPVIKFDLDVALTLSDPMPAAMLNSPVPVQHAHEYFSDPSRQFSVGVWQTTGYERKLWNSPRYELMYLTEGSVTFGNDRGEVQVFRQGDTFFVPLGAPTTWTSEGTLRKVYCIFQPRA